MAGAPVSKRQVITDYSPGYLNEGRAHGVRRVVLQLFGLLGHGKSSLINSSLCVITNGGRYQNTAFSAPSEGGLTTRRVEYPLNPNLVLIDNRGLRHMNAAELLECSAQFRHLRELGEVTWTGISIIGASKVIAEGARTEATDLLVPVFVWSCRANLYSSDENEIKSLLEKAYSSTGIRPIVVLTHSSSRNPEDLINRFRTFQVSRSFSLENYTRENHHQKPETDGTIVDFLYYCLMTAEERIKELGREDRSARVVQQATEQVQEETRVLRATLERLSSVLKK